MKNKISFFLLILCFTISQSQDFVLITSKGSGLTQITKNDLKRLYTGKSQTIDGKKALPINMSLDNPVSVKFIQSITGMSAVDYKSFWMAEQVRGGGSAPKVVKSNDAVITAISEDPNTIGYIDKSALTDTVKVISIE